MSNTLQPGAWLECVGPTGRDSPLVVGQVYRCLAVDARPERCTVHEDRGCGGVMVDGALPAAGFWFCERLFKPIDKSGEGLLDEVLHRVAA